MLRDFIKLARVGVRDCEIINVFIVKHDVLIKCKR